MKNKHLVSLCLLAAVCAGPVRADDVKDLIKAKHCYDCHGDKSGKVGPAFRDISRRFRGLNNAKTMLVRMVQNGTDSQAVVYHWGASTMPPGEVRVPVSQAEAEQLVDYILSLK
ncbi:MAG: c-type cytochrome [Nevskia sp.]|nr:c-type cytochrome [Nevskia sp.]